MTRRRPPVRGRTVPFGAHQALEYLTAALVVSTAIRLRTGLAVPVLAAGLAILALAAVTEGPWCALRWLSRRVHATADWVLAALLSAVPFLALDLEADLVAGIVLWAAAALVAFLALSTDYRSRSERRASAPVASRAPHGAAIVNSTARTLGRRAGRAPRSLGRAVGRRRARRLR